MPHSRPARRVIVLVFLGTFLAQAAWILVLPPFRGIDEFDHAYRAAAVAHGEWMPELRPAAHGRGDLVTVPRSIVAAAQAQCSALEYTGQDNCNPVSDEGDGMVTVASAAARYHPVFYWVIGTPARMFDGATALLAMRFVGAFLCAGMVTFAARNVLLWSSSRWPLRAILASLTPVLVYSTAVAAPNGFEMTAALALWASLLGLTKEHLSLATERALLWSTVPSAMVVATVRTLGPLWFVLMTATIIAICGFPHVIAIIRRHARLVTVITAILTATTLASVWWIVANDVNQPEVLGRYHHPFANTLNQVPLWIFQSIAAFPVRNEQAPGIVYAAELLILGALVGTALRVGSRRSRCLILVMSGLAILVPFVLTLLTYESAGAIWQGRYGLPYSVGLVLLAGVILDSSGVHYRLLSPVLLASWLALASAHIIAIANVLVREFRNEPSAGDASWLMPSPSSVVVLMLSGWLLWAVALVQRHEPVLDEPVNRTPAST